ncbi:MAG: NAD(P)-dependent glycerol-3-phosphate dehydrogenase [Candidatus Aureabacteria bacterium]|nr:NAD(P)-dependent glycerol-3-phosphate dehydrogenase [Candidatus Auribacterota bacterium]
MIAIAAKEGRRVAVLGDGGWGTTLALLLHRKGVEVVLWGAFPRYVEFLREKRMNRKFLPGIRIPSSLPITSRLDEAVDGAGVIVAAVPSHFMRRICRRMARLLSPESRPMPLFISGTKGIETNSLMRMSQVIEAEIPGIRVAVLSGPSHAEEVVRESPTTVVVSSRRHEASAEAQRLFMTERFRVYTNDDLVGVEIAGAVKNVIAIAAGACDGLGFGDNAKAALITRGIVEIARLGVAMGARAGTFSGLAGIGDLIATCVSRYGRNRRVGEMIAKGKTLKQVLRGMEMVAEGVLTTKASRRLALRYGVEMPITEQIYAVLYRRKDPETAVRELMMRSPKAELENGL